MAHIISWNLKASRKKRFFFRLFFSGKIAGSVFPYRADGEFHKFRVIFHMQLAHQPVSVRIDASYFNSKLLRHFSA
jgi:hypothetical protein